MTILEHGTRGWLVLVRLSDDSDTMEWHGSPASARNVAAKLMEHADKAEAVRRNAESAV